MAARSISLVLIVAIMAFSCAEEDGPKGLTNARRTETDTLNLDSNDTLNFDSTFQHCDSLFIVTFSGTACCLSGPTVAKPGDTLSYHYQMNHKDPQVDWIIEGDMSIIGGQGSPTATVLFGPNFTKGLIRSVGYGLKYDTLRQNCNDRVVVTSD